MNDPIIRAIDEARRLDAADEAAWNTGDNTKARADLIAARTSVTALAPTSLEGACALAIWLAEEIRRDCDTQRHVHEASSRLAEWAQTGVRD